jgi:acetate CoA/acetoacetate CoA-transferase beta subunit
MGIKPERERIARRIAKEFSDGWVVNLGIGLPTLVADYVPKDVNIILQSENGFVGMGPRAEEGKEDKDLTNAGGVPVTVLPGAAFFDSVDSFAIIRGGHLDATVLGVLQVDQEGNLANYMIPGKFTPGIGGAMDLTVGAKRVFAATDHCAKDGSPKIMKKCLLPLTAKNQVNYIVTELAFMEVTKDGLVLREIYEGTTVDEVISKTDAELIIPEKVGTFS